MERGLRRETGRVPGEAEVDIEKAASAHRDGAERGVLEPGIIKDNG